MKYSTDDQNTLAMDQANITTITDNQWAPVGTVADR